MDPAISKFLKQYYVEGVVHTHVSLINPKGKFQLNRESIENFWNIYCPLIKDDDENKVIVGIGQKPQTYLPVLGDIDIKISEQELEIDPEQEHLYTEKNLLDTVQVYQSIIRNTVENCTEEHLLCVVLEKPIYSETKNDIVYYKNGFHLHFPYCFLNKVDIEVHIIPRIKNSLKELNTFENLGFEDSGSLVDKSVIKSQWLLYGSRKEGNIPYKVTKIFNSDCEEIDLDEAFKYYNIFDYKERPISIKGNVKEYLPRILSITPDGRPICELKYGLESPLKEKNRNEKNIKSNRNSKSSVAENLKVASKILPLLSNFRSDDFHEWINIGWCLYSISDGCLEGFELWNEFSSRSSSYDENRCIYEWERMVKKDYTIATLHFFAKQDNPNLYQQFKDEQSEEHLKNSLEGSHNDIAKLMYSEYGTQFVCASVKNDVWYQFKDHHWKEIEDGVYLRRLISDDIVNKYIDEACKLIKKMGTSDKAEETMHQVRVKQIQKLISQLKNSSFKNQVMREACEVFYNENFKNKLDMNPYLFGFKNGVYDLKLNEFRPGRPEDFISKSAPIDYINFDKDNDRVLQVYDFLEKVFPDTSIRNYFLDTTSDVFVGGNFQKIGIFWTGEGDNGKSVTQTIVEKMLGEYAIKISTTLLTSKKSNIGNANPELARAGGGVRWAAFEEPDKEEEINGGIFKSITGNDSYWARDLFEKGKSTREIIPLFKTIIVCNYLPRFRGGSSDKAIWNRTRVVPFESTFIRPGLPCPDTYEEQLRTKQFPMDTEFGKKIPSLLEPFAWVLLEHRKNIKVRIEPEKVRAATDMYRKQNDIYRQFVDECIIQDNSAFINLNELKIQFQEWFKDIFTNQTPPNKNDIKEYFTKLWDEPLTGAKWKGYRFRTLKDDEEEGNIIILNKDDLDNEDDEEYYEE